MKQIILITAILFTFIIISGCSKENPVNTNPVIPNEPYSAIVRYQSPVPFDSLYFTHNEIQLDTIDLTNPPINNENNKIYVELEYSTNRTTYFYCNATNSPFTNTLLFRSHVNPTSTHISFLTDMSFVGKFMYNFKATITDSSHYFVIKSLEIRR